jgi:hypothetical protein
LRWHRVCTDQKLLQWIVEDRISLLPGANENDGSDPRVKFTLKLSLPCLIPSSLNLKQRGFISLELELLYAFLNL